MSSMTDVLDVAGRHGLTLRRAWPRSADHLLLDLGRPDGTAVAGQWFADPAVAADVARRTGTPASADGTVVLQPDGADRRLRILAGLVGAVGSQLVAHRPERRAVVRDADGSYVKVVRPERAAAVARAARSAGRLGVRVPAVLDVDAACGTVRTSALPGRTLHDLLAGDAPGAVHAARALGRTLAALHRSPLPAGLPLHDAASERRVVETWRSWAALHGVLGTGSAPGAAPASGPLPVQPVPIHRDLHDKQVLIEPDGAVALLDFDLVSAGDAALDVANVLVHVELRARQGRCSLDAAVEVGHALLAAYDPAPHVLERLPFYDATSRHRLAAVYGFRPASTAAARRLVCEPVAWTGAAAGDRTPRGLSRWATQAPRPSRSVAGSSSLYPGH